MRTDKNPFQIIYAAFFQNYNLLKIIIGLHHAPYQNWLGSLIIFSFSVQYPMHEMRGYRLCLNTMH